MRHLRLLVCCSLVWPSATFASNWIKVPELNVGGGAASVDMETLTVEHGIVTFWEKVDYADGSIDRAHLSIDCNKRTWRPLYGLSTDPRGNKKEEMSAPEPIKDIPPDTMIDNMRREVCLIPAIGEHLPKHP